MLSKKTITDIQAVLGIDNLADLIDGDKENEIEVPTLFTEEQKKTFGQNRFSDGKTAFGEIWTKDMKLKYPDIKYSDKNPEEFMEKFSEAKVAEIGEEPDERVKILKAEKKELQGKLKTATEANVTIKSEYEGKIFGLSSSSNIAGLIPDNTIIPKSQILTIFNSVIETKKDEDDNIFHERAGKVLKDDLGNYLSTETVVNSFVDENKFIKVGGTGGDDEDEDSDTVLYKTTSDYLEGMEKRNIPAMSKEGIKILNESKAIKGFDANA